MERLNESVIWRRVQRFLKSGRETPKVDFKAKLELSSARNKSEFVKDVTAIANTPGGDGFLVIGVAEKDNTIQILGFSPPEGSDILERQMVSVLTYYSDPPPEIEYYQLEIPSHEFPCKLAELSSGEASIPLGIVRIRPTRRPHKIVRDSDTIRKDEVYIRRGSATFRASPEDIVMMSTLETLKEIVVLNLSAHPLTDKQRDQLQHLESAYIVEEVEIPAHFDPRGDVERQVKTVVEKIGFCIEEWSGAHIYVVLPGLAPAAAAVLAYFHGLRGGFPKIVWIYQNPSDPTQYEIAQIINLQSLRDEARQLRSERIKRHAES